MGKIEVFFVVIGKAQGINVMFTRCSNFRIIQCSFPHNQHIFLHNIPENFSIIFKFFLHPIRCPVITSIHCQLLPTSVGMLRSSLYCQFLLN